MEEGTESARPGPNAGPPGDALVEERRAKRDGLRRRGLDPYPLRFDRTDTAAQLHERYADLGPDTRTGAEVSVAGRVASIRGHGKLVFATLQDVSGGIQLLMSAAELGDDATAVRDALDLGDWVGATGEVVTSRRGELSVDVVALSMLSKAVRPLPDKWHGLNDEDTRYRQREVDLLANADSRRVFDIRFKTLASLRSSDGRGGVRRGRDARPPEPGRWCHRQAVPDPLQRARYRPEPAHRPGALPEAPRGRRLRTRSSRSRGTSATRASTRDTAPSSRRSRRTRPSATCTTAWT